MSAHHSQLRSPRAHPVYIRREAELASDETGLLQCSEFAVEGRRWRHAQRRCRNADGIDASVIDGDGSHFRLFWIDMERWRASNKAPRSLYEPRVILVISAAELIVRPARRNPYKPVG